VPHASDDSDHTVTIFGRLLRHFYFHGSDAHSALGLSGVDALYKLFYLFIHLQIGVFVSNRGAQTVKKRSFQSCAFFACQIYEGKNWNRDSDLTVYATGACLRPFFVSAGNNITVLFRTGTNIDAHYIGFRASYYFVSSM